MGRKRTLTWHKPSKRWKKQISGVVYYFGKGKGESDSAAYREAERRYFEFMDEREQTALVEVALEDATVVDICEKYCQVLEARYASTQAAVQNGATVEHTDSVTANHVAKMRALLNQFIEGVGNQPFPSVRELALADYRQAVLALPISEQTGKPISPHTAQARLAAVKSLYYWAYEMGLCELPRNLRKYTRVDLPQPEPQVFTSGELQQLWAAAPQRLKCLMALALNCGFGQQDLADLCINEIDLKKGVIDRRRSKTGVRARYKLWPITVKLLKEQIPEDIRTHDRVFRTQCGRPLVENGFKDGRLTRSDSVSCAFRRIMKKVGLNSGRGFYTLRKTGATLIEAIDPSTTEMYLAHAARGMKRNYAERNWAALEAALTKLNRKLRLRR